MQVTSPCPCRRHTMRRPFAAVLMLALAGGGTVAHGAGFDEKLKAPMMTSAAQTHAQAKEFGARYRQVRAATPMQVITNKALAREKFDLKWQVEKAIDQRKPIPEFAELGFESIGGGSYQVDLNLHPEWDDLPGGFVSILSGPDLGPLMKALAGTGFRPEDTAALTDYIRTHDAKSASKLAVLPISLAFARTVHKFDKANRPVPDALVLSYVYQCSLAISESNRQWVEGLLKQFDPQRARILLSVFMEFGSYVQWHPTDPALVIADQLNTVRLPNYEELAKAEAGVTP